MPDSLFISRPLHCLPSSEPQVFYRFLGIAAASIMMSELTIMIFELVTIYFLNRLSRTLMEEFASFDQQRAIDYVLCERVLEDILYFWKRRLLVDELRLLQARQARLQGVFGL